MTTTPPAQVRPPHGRALLAALATAGLLAVSACAQDDTAPEEGGVAAEETGAEETGAEETGAEETGADGIATEGTAAAGATLLDADGTEIGTATFTESDDGLQIEAQIRSDLEAGFYGFHIHGVGECEPDSAAPDDPEDTGDFMSAGGHLGGDEAEHPDHAGDLPPLLVTAGGQGWLTVITDRLTLADLADDDGAALMVHDGHDNFANVPERYAPEGPDEDTLGTGDAGGRLACGVIETD